MKIRIENLLVLGASARAATQSVVRGHCFDRTSVTAADLFADRDTVEACSTLRVRDYPSEFLSIAKQLRKGQNSLAVVYTGALENYPALLESLAADHLLLGNEASVVRRVRDPFLLQDVFRSHGIPFPETYRTNRHKVRPTQTWLKKQRCSAAGLQVEVLNSSTSPPNEDYYVQEFLPGMVASGAFVADGVECHLLGVSEMLVGCEWLGAKDFCYCGSLTRTTDQEEKNQWQTIGELLCREFQLVGVFGVDAILRNGRVVPLEVNPRYTASMELYENGKLTVMDRHIHAALRDRSIGICNESDASGSRPVVAGKCILFARHSTDFPQDFSSLQLPDVRIADIPQPQKINAGHPILTILSQASTRESLMEKLQTASQHTYRQLR